jgi:hypothetical protein
MSDWTPPPPPPDPKRSEKTNWTPPAPKSQDKPISLSSSETTASFAALLAKLRKLKSGRVFFILSIISFSTLFGGLNHFLLAFVNCRRVIEMALDDNFRWGSLALYFTILALIFSFIQKPFTHLISGLLGTLCIACLLFSIKTALASNTVIQISFWLTLIFVGLGTFWEFNLFKNNRFVVAAILIVALLFGGTAYFNSASTILSYSFLLDGKELPINRTIEVKVDGQPFEDGNYLKPGPHKISVQLANAEPYEKHFWIFYGTKDLGSLPLETSKGSLSVTVNPSPATVIVQREGESDRQGDAPLHLDKLPVGNYALVIKRGEYEEAHIITIQRQQLTQTNIDLNLGNVDLSSTPTNTEFEISGNNRHWQGKLPTHIDDIPAGDYTLLLRRGAYTEQDALNIIRQQRLETNIVMNLGSVDLSAEPADAKYDLSGNGKHWQGKLPARVEDVPVGDYTLSVTRRGWALDSDISITRGGVTTNKTEFPYGAIEVTSEPTGLAVATNGVEIGKTPIILQELKPATYNLTVSDGENDLMADVSVGPKENAKHDFIFRYGTIQLMSAPAGATVIRKGKEIGKTPLTLNHVPAGDSSVGLSLDGYVATNLIVSAIENAITNFSVKLVSEQYLQAMSQAQEALDAGKIDDARTNIAKALAIDPDDMAAISLQSRIKDAEQVAEKAIEAQVEEQSHNRAREAANAFEERMINMEQVIKSRPATPRLYVSETAAWRVRSDLMQVTNALLHINGWHLWDEGHPSPNTTIIFMMPKSILSALADHNIFGQKIEPSTQLNVQICEIANHTQDVRAKLIYGFAPSGDYNIDTSIEQNYQSSFYNFKSNFSKDLDAISNK